jgi:hypothetical protein
MQEPYSIESKVPGLGTEIAIACRVSKQDPPMAAVGIRSRHMTAFEIAGLCTKHCVCVQISDEATGIYVVSQYFPPTENIEIGVRQLGEVLNHLKGRKAIIGIDANAKSPLWNSRSTNDRGSSHRTILPPHPKQPGQAYTFETTRERSNIDIILASPELIPLVEEWKVHEDGTFSDRRILETRLDLDKYSTPPHQQERKYNMSAANWEECERVLLEEKKELRETTLERAYDVERMAEQLQATLIRAYNASIPRKKWHNWSVPWWTPELTTGKRRTYRARRRYQATKDPTTREQEKLRYREFLLMCKKAVTKARTQNW